MPSLKAQIRRIERTIEKLKKESRGRHFASITSDEIERRLKLAKDPFILSLGWDPYTKPGGNIEAHVTVYVFEPSVWDCLHLWVGSGMVDPGGDTILLNVDTRFPRLTQRPLRMEQVPLKFTLQIPTTIEKTTYFLWFCLLRTFHDRKIFDRFLGHFEVR